MVTIYLPTFAAFKDDVKNVFSLIEKEILKKYQGKINAGLEIYGKPEHFSTRENLEKMVENVKTTAGNIKTIVHGIVGDIYPLGIVDMRKDAGKNVLIFYIDLGQMLKSEYVHTHGGAGYIGIKIPEDKQQGLREIKDNYLECLKRSKGIPLGIENAPNPSGGDTDDNPKTVWSDYVQGIEDCMQIVKDTSLKITFDTAHYGSDKFGDIDLINPLKTIGKYLGHIHLGDYASPWIPNKSKFLEGIVPGEGRIGKDEFKRFFEYIKENYSDIGVGIEIINENYKELTETKKCLNLICPWLKE